ncbi:pilus assembly protein PilP [Paracidovorax valerianellae]|uniref:Type IV pilus assembly protein PilP n=1 Tax=Paracidovorax valerianellae TaxID=187868 RepID=A0A1G6T9B1_9BURK|nr:pilus assembly protein PilP [Paracidovorax valerianellae]MDA8445536.1 pilus assembly protein PilP [Paracidovorax valerianellae]SDD25641.1 type IV pilus assembly protein PilP [Paracidovorax valerianellae]
MRTWQIACLALCAVLAGCGSSGEDELRQWMTELRANTKPRITPLTEPKQFQPQNYNAEGATDPFNSVKLTQALRRDSTQLAANATLIAPEMARRKEPLEAYPLDTMAMVGSLNKTGNPTALLKVDNLLYQVRVGNYLGQNYGRITQITETAIQLREVVQDATGDWIERQTTLDLQEGKK